MLLAKAIKRDTYPRIIKSSGDPTFFPLIGGIFGILIGFVGLASDVIGLIFLVIVVAKS